MAHMENGLERSQEALDTEALLPLERLSKLYEELRAAGSDRLLGAGKIKW